MCDELNLWKRNSAVQDDSCHQCFIGLVPHRDGSHQILAVAYPGILFGRGEVQRIQLRTEDRENGDLGAVAPLSGVLEAAVIWCK